MSKHKYKSGDKVTIKPYRTLLKELGYAEEYCGTIYLDETLNMNYEMLAMCGKEVEIERICNNGDYRNKLWYKIKNGNGYVWSENAFIDLYKKKKLFQFEKLNIVLEK